MHLLSAAHRRLATPDTSTLHSYEAIGQVQPHRLVCIAWRAMANPDCKKGITGPAVYQVRHHRYRDVWRTSPALLVDEVLVIIMHDQCTPHASTDYATELLRLGHLTPLGLICSGTPRRLHIPRALAHAVLHCMHRGMRLQGLTHKLLDPVSAKRQKVEIGLCGCQQTLFHMLTSRMIPRASYNDAAASAMECCRFTRPTCS